jgi:RimJ/RimL family protein N-acetyltransferase
MRVELRTPRLLLRELALSDAPAANVYERDLAVVQYTGHGALTLSESEARIQRAIDSAATVPRRVFDLAVTRASDGVFLGRAGLAITDDRQAMLWYIVDRQAWGTGTASEAARAVCDFGFGELALHRIWVDIDPRNVASVRVAEKLGFRHEAHLIANVRIKSVWTDTLIMAVLRHEWR